MNNNNTASLPFLQHTIANDMHMVQQISLPLYHPSSIVYIQNKFQVQKKPSNGYNDLISYQLRKFHSR